MHVPTNRSRVIRFGVFEVDLQESELRKSGIRIKLQEQPFQILSMLLERPGQVVSRDELQRRLWPADTFVDFDHSLNASIRKLREALGDRSENPRFIETLHRRGYRFVASVDGAHALAPEHNEQLPAPAAARTVSKNLARWQRWAVIAASIGLAVVGDWYLRSGRTAQIDSIAVLPFTNGGGDANTDYLSDGITESLIDNLARVPQLRVKSRTSVFRYKGKDVDVQKVGKDLGVSALVSGRVTPQGDSIEVSAELTDVQDSTVIWGQHYSGKSTDIIWLQQRITADIAEKLRSKLSVSEKRQVTKQGTQNPEAYDLYLRGRYSWNKRRPSDIETAISFFNQAIAKDPGYALAYSGLADAYSVFPTWGGNPSESYTKASAAARRALELDATLAHPHAVLGWNEMVYDWDFAGGEAEFKKAFELDPHDATAHQWYGAVIGYLGGREREALAEVNLAHQLDPLSPIISYQIGWVHIAARRYDDAIVVCKKLAIENPTFAPAHECLAGASWGKHMCPQVIEEWRAYGQLSGDRNESEFASAAKQGFRSAGWKGALTKGIEIRQIQRESGYSYAYNIAAMYADSGDSDAPSGGSTPLTGSTIGG